MSYKLSENDTFFILPNPYTFISLLCLVASIKTSYIILNRRDESGHHYFNLNRIDIFIILNLPIPYVFHVFFFNPHLQTFFHCFQGERKGDTERETSIWERNIIWLPLLCAPIGDQTHNPGILPHQELDPQSFSLQCSNHLATLARAVFPVLYFRWYV